MNFEYIIFGIGICIVILGFLILNKSIENIEVEYLKDERFELILSKVQNIEKALANIEKKDIAIQNIESNKINETKKEVNNRVNLELEKEKINDFFLEEIDENDKVERMSRSGYSKEEIGKKLGKSIREVDLMIKMKKGGKI